VQSSSKRGDVARGRIAIVVIMVAFEPSVARRDRRRPDARVSDFVRPLRLVYDRGVDARGEEFSRPGLWSIVGLAAVGWAGCGVHAARETLAARGRVLFATPPEGGNSLSCAHCHVRDEPADDGFRRAGHPLLGAGGRSKFKAYEGRTATSLVEAFNVCLNQWMVAPLWTEDEERFDAVHMFLEATPGVSDPPSEPLHVTLVSAPSDLRGGDPTQGEALFDGSCAICHGRGAMGAEHAPGLAGRKLDPAYVARRIRTSGLQSNAEATPFATGRMPFWSVERLSDGELRDLVAFIAR
jgi:mono/diheme cytochrome c family protein